MQLKKNIAFAVVLIFSFVLSVAFAEVHVFNVDGVGPIIVAATLDVRGNSAELHAAAWNDSTQPIAHTKFCVQIALRPKGCDFEIWTTAV